MYSISRFIDIANNILKIKTLIIESKSKLNNKEFLKLSKTYLFYLAYNRNHAVSLRNNPLNISSRVIPNDHYYNSTYILDQNLNDELIDYYKKDIISK